jgi:SAM-dependent methyltransferase
MSDYKHLPGEQYNILYAKYLEKPARLIAAADVNGVKNLRLLDLCSGSGALVRAAIRLGVDPKNIVAVEEESSMLDGLSRIVTVYNASITYLGLFDRLGAMQHPFDLITCRQAVNYWWHVEIVERIVELLRKGGQFVFNTFNTKADDVPHTKQYIHENRQYAEIAYCIGNVVHHVQACEGLPMHLTTFKWIDPYRFKGDLDTLVEFERISGWERRREGATDTYIVRAIDG